MSEVTRILSAIEQGDPSAAEQLLPLVYDELRGLAAAQMAREKPGHTLDATALVHEAYLRLVTNPARAGGGSSSSGAERSPPPARAGFAGRAHFFLAAAEAMRRILIDSARKKRSLKRGGGRRRVDLLEALPAGAAPDEELLALDDALGRLAAEQPRMVQLVKLRFFAGLTLEQAAEALAVSPSTAKRDWTFARAWLRRDMDREK